MGNVCCATTEAASSCPPLTGQLNNTRKNLPAVPDCMHHDDVTSSGAPPPPDCSRTSASMEPPNPNGGQHHMKDEELLIDMNILRGEEGSEDHRPAGPAWHPASSLRVLGGSASRSSGTRISDDDLSYKTVAEGGSLSINSAAAVTTNAALPPRTMTRGGADENEQSRWSAAQDPTSFTESRFLRLPHFDSVV